MDESTLPYTDASYRALRVLYVIPGEEEAVSMSFSRRQAASVTSLGLHVRCFFLRSRTSPQRILREMKRLRAECAEFKPDVIHAQFGTVTGMVAAITSRIPLIITFHGSDLNPSPGTSLIRSITGRVLSHMACMRAQQVVCVSLQLRQRISYRKRGVHVLCCGVNGQHFRPMPRDECRSQLGWPMNEKVVLFNARNDPVGKRLDLAQAAVKLVQRSMPNLRLHILRGTTHPDDMPLYYNAADALLMTSDYEGSPMVIKEALACNLPIVSVDVGDVVERLRGVSRCAVAARDPADLANRLATILASEVRSDGRRRLADFSEESVAKKLNSIYREATGITIAGTTAEVVGPVSTTNTHESSKSRVA